MTVTKLQLCKFLGTNYTMSQRYRENLACKVAKDGIFERNVSCSLFTTKDATIGGVLSISQSCLGNSRKELCTLHKMIF